MAGGFFNVYDDDKRAEAYAQLEYPGTYYLAFRDLPALFAKHVRGSRALDFGCGTGRSTRFLRDHGFEVVGVDIARPMLVRARELDPDGDYRLVPEGDFGSTGGKFDLVFSAFTFDNIATLSQRESVLVSLRGLLNERGRIVSVVSSPDIYVNEWVSFSTAEYPENRSAVSGDTVKIMMLDVPDHRPVHDVVCTGTEYTAMYARAGYVVLETLTPRAWKSETEIAPWVIYVLGSKES
jgi:SAM-dependent methyltransferase